MKCRGGTLRSKQTPKRPWTTIGQEWTTRLEILALQIPYQLLFCR